MYYKTMLLLCLFCFSCSDQSVGIALDANSRVENIQDTIQTNQSENLRQYMYNDLKNWIEDLVSRQLTETEAEYLNTMWNRRDVMETWQVQWERARALKMATVEAKLVDDQAVFDKMYKYMKRAYNKATTSQPGE